ncbi:UPF0149 family protein [Pleionea sediminis]|uniref:UPF0149 family protein n=1 Tax=Pleionea sediminis TaxID=2569479 RepID=UPI001184A806|nr:UPF0149 family protein [Pleionea sediminis]
MELVTPLNSDEIDRLSANLNQLDGLDISTIDGLFTALVSAPALTSPEDWLSVIFDKSQWQETSELMEHTYRLLVRHFNGIESILARAPERFTPLFLERDLHDSVDLIVENWCRGYVKGIALCRNQWDTNNEFMQSRLYPVILFGGSAGKPIRQSADRKQILSWKQAIPENVREIYTFWSSTRPVFEKPSPFIRKDKLGRNELCNCGSGKKYKRCCGAH